MNYIVQPGDWMAKIALEHRTTVSAIWNHPNNADHRRKRSSPDILYAGDVLFLPEGAPELPQRPPQAPPGQPPAPPSPRRALPDWPYDEPPPELTTARPTWDCPAGSCVCRPDEHVRDLVQHTVFLHDREGQRMRGARCRIFQNGRLLTEYEHADGEGALTISVRPTWTELVVEWAPADTPLEPPYPLRRRYSLTLTPSSTPADVPVEDIEQRLDHLGFYYLPTLPEKLRSFADVYHLPRVGHDVLVGLVLVAHDTAALPPATAAVDASKLLGPPDLRPPAQGVLAALRAPRDLRCHLTYQLLDDLERTPIAGAPYIVATPFEIWSRGVTDAQGNISPIDVVADDFTIGVNDKHAILPALAANAPGRLVVVTGGAPIQHRMS